MTSAQRINIPIVLLCLFFTGCSGSIGLDTDSVGETGFFSSADGTRLYYSFDTPVGDGPFPVIILGHGSGRVTIEDYASRAESLVEHGVAALRFDKRGVGRSEGEYSRAFGHLPVLAEDMVAAVEYVSTQQVSDLSKIGLMGASQAGWVIPVAANLAGEVDFTIIL